MTIAGACPSCGCAHLAYESAVECIWPGRFAAGPGGPWAVPNCHRSVGIYQEREHAQRAVEWLDRDGCSHGCERRRPGGHEIVRLPYCPTAHIPDDPGAIYTDGYSSSPGDDW